MKRVFLFILPAWLYLFCSIPVFAQTEDNVGLDRIVVTPSRIEENYSESSRKVEIITEKDITKSVDSDLADTLDSLSSVNLGNYGGLGATKNLRMRGSSASQVLVLVDGRPINNPRDGTAELSEIPLEDVSRIEVMHGPGSNLYGSSAMAGTVNIITKNPPKEKQKFDFTTSFGTFRTYQERLSYGIRLNEKFGAIINSSYQSTEGFRANSEFNSRNADSKFEYLPNDNNVLTLTSGFYNSNTGNPGPINSPDMDDKQDSIKNFQYFNWEFTPDDKISVSTKIYNNHDELSFSENTAGSIFDTTDKKSVHTTKVQGIDFQFSNKPFEFYSWVCGFNYVVNKNESTESAKHKYNVRAGYFNNQIDLFKDFSIEFGARFDDYSNFGTEFNPSFSFLYNINEKHKIHGLISRSFRAPTFNDLYWPDEGWAKGNPNIKPEKGITGEFGIESEVTKNFITSLNYFRSDYNDLINWGEEDGVWIPKNVDSAIINGVELQNRFILSDNLEFSTNYTYLNAKNEKLHKYLVYQPKYKAALALKYTDLKGLNLEFRGDFTDKRYHDPQNTVKVKRFFVFGFSASKKIRDGFTYFLSINNLFNRQYEYIKNYPVPGFSFTNGIKLEF